MENLLCLIHTLMDEFPKNLTATIIAYLQSILMSLWTSLNGIFDISFLINFTKYLRYSLTNLHFFLILSNASNIPMMNLFDPYLVSIFLSFRGLSHHFRAMHNRPPSFLIGVIVFSGITFFITYKFHGWNFSWYSWSYSLFHHILPILNFSNFLTIFWIILNYVFGMIINLR